VGRQIPEFVKPLGYLPTVPHTHTHTHTHMSRPWCFGRVCNHTSKRNVSVYLSTWSCNFQTDRI